MGSGLGLVAKVIDGLLAGWANLLLFTPPLFIIPLNGIWLPFCGLGLCLVAKLIDWLLLALAIILLFTSFMNQKQD